MIGMKEISNHDDLVTNNKTGTQTFLDGAK